MNKQYTKDSHTLNDTDIFGGKMSPLDVKWKNLLQVVVGLYRKYRSIKDITGESQTV